MATSGTVAVSTPSTTAVETTAATTGSLVEQVCAAITTEALAAEENRTSYLQHWARIGRNAGFGIGPTLTLAARALKSGDDSAFVHWIGLAQSNCDRATS